MIALFEKTLKRMKQELCDLKTEHNRGLGTIEFFRSRSVYTTPHAGYYVATAAIATGEPSYPLLSTMIRTPEPHSLGTNAFIDYPEASSTQVKIHVYAQGSTQITLDVISSSILGNFTWSEE